MRVPYCCIGFSWVLQFYDADRNTIHEEQNVRTAILLALLHNKLVYTTEDITIRMFKVDILHTERCTAIIAIRKVVAVTIQQEGILTGIVVVLATYISEVCHYIVHLCLCQPFLGILSFEECPQILFYQRVCELTMQFIAKSVLPVSLLQQLYGSFLKLTFVIFTFIRHNLCIILICISMCNYLHILPAMRTQNYVFGYTLAIVWVFFFLLRYILFND